VSHVAGAAIQAHSHETRQDGAVIDEELRKKTFAVQSLAGQRARLDALLRLITASMTSENWEVFRNILASRKESKSQFMQDMFALVLAAKPRGERCFVEFGACDGVHLSNTYLLEKAFEWTGLLAEPALCWHDGLRKNRSCDIDM
jgi:hypothetical protein